jgi:cyclohexadieny/prephenate dehydrogenase
MKAAFNRLTIIGLGLIGSSIARAAHESGVASTIVGVDSNEVSLVYARKQGFIHHTSVNAADACEDSDLIIIATPTHLLADICEAIAPKLIKNAIVMDTGSVKQMPLAIMTELLPPHVMVIPAHPIAGSEQSGVMAGRIDLLEKKRVIITPSAPLSNDQLQKINQFWQALGARVEAMPADLHDTVYGYVSHLPQLLAFALRPILPAGELERFMRISHSDAALWSGIFLLNADVIKAALTRYLDVIVHIRRELASAPEGTPSTESDATRLVLFPRVVASCLITTVMEAEKKSGVGFMRFAGTGFADFASPATSAPDEHLEHISNHYLQMAELLAAFEERLEAIHDALVSEDAELLAKTLE